MRKQAGKKTKAGVCRWCGCTDDDCSGCIERTGEPCYWVAADLCSACADTDVYWASEKTEKPRRRRAK